MGDKISELPETTLAEENDELLINQTENDIARKITPRTLIDSIEKTDLDMGIIDRKHLDSNIFLSKTASTMNPVPTTTTEIANSSVSFTLEEPCYLLVIYGGRAQTNTDLTLEMWLNVDGGDTGQSAVDRRYTNGTSTNYNSVSHSQVLTVGIGLHTLKLRAKATLSNAAVWISPYIRGIFVSQSE